MIFKPLDITSQPPPTTHRYVPEFPQSMHENPVQNVFSFQLLCVHELVFSFL